MRFMLGQFWYDRFNEKQSRSHLKLYGGVSLKLTIYDVAREAGVSIATVSKVINETGRISKKTRMHVQEVMQRMQFEPSVVASALMGKSTFTIGLIIPDLANPFFAEIARSVEDRGSELGFNLVICSTDHRVDKEMEYMALLQKKRVDGIIMGTGTRNLTMLEELMTKKYPMALIAREAPAIEVNSVLVDDFRGGYLATEHLLQLGHRHIAIISEPLSLKSSQERIRGYREAHHRYSVAPDERLITVSDHSTLEGGRAIAEKLLQLPNRPSAIFACNDLLAIGAMQTARELGIDVPGDVSIIGFDNTILATITTPPLTTIAQPIQHIGRQVTDLLVQDIKEGNAAKQRIVMQPELVIRQTTAVFPGTKN